MRVLFCENPDKGSLLVIILLVMVLLVLPKVGRIRRCIATQLTLIRFLAGVRSHVNFEILRRLERSAAVRACKWPFTEMVQ